MSKRSKAEASPKRLVVGFVCEGSTDIVVLRKVAEVVLGTIDARPLQPETDELDRQKRGGKSGWSEVRAWCERVSSLREYFDPLIGDPFDILVIAIDFDIAIAAGLAKRPENLSPYDTAELCRVVKSWLRAPLPGKVVIAIPVASTEAWLVSALFPKQKHPEHMINPAQVLVDKGKIEMGNNGPWKRAAEYRDFAEAVAKNFKRVRQSCTEMDRLATKLENLKQNARAK